ncbi:nuclear transport factor 2 family protein [Sphingorhabdus sp.]|uniref:nuclear transport factor 2 family protein n=1 Tax=Sphingorhabdus sp. TaxID=1902408 RepID=UPI003593E532
MIARDQILDTIDQIYTARVAGDKSSFARYWAEGSTYEMMGAPQTLGEQSRTKNDARTAIGELIDTFKFHTVNLVDSVVDGNRAVVRLQIDVSTGGGPIHNTELLNIWEFDDAGKVQSLAESVDTALVARMLSGE